jgi:pimeloyl-ACP methyl ester carboxylesterase
MEKLVMLVLRIFALLTVLTFLGLILFYIFQDKLIFYPSQITQAEANDIKKSHNNIEEIEIKTKDGINLKGWLVNDGSKENRGFLFYFGGNAEEVSYLIDEPTGLKNWSLVLVNYRGYGQSQGKVSERSLYSDAIEIYDYFTGRSNIKEPKIAIMGRSIGTGVATSLASQRKCDAVVLVSPFTSLKDVAKIHYPFLPVELVLKYKFDSIKRVPGIKAPALILVAAEDGTIPAKLSYSLAEKWGGKVIVKELPGADHNSISSDREYWKTIKLFLDNI